MKRSLIFASDLFIMCDLGKRDFISQLFFITKLKMKLLQIVSYTLAIVYSSYAQNPGKMKKNETFFCIFSTLCIRRDESCQNLIFSTFPPLLSLQLFFRPEGKPLHFCQQDIFLSHRMYRTDFLGLVQYDHSWRLNGSFQMPSGHVSFMSGGFVHPMVQIESAGPRAKVAAWGFAPRTFLFWSSSHVSLIESHFMYPKKHFYIQTFQVYDRHLARRWRLVYLPS